MGFEYQPTFFLQNTDTTYSKIDTVKIYHLGHTATSQVVHYSYKVEDSLYQGNYRLKAWSNRKSKGQKIKVEYAIDDPQESKIIAYYVMREKPF